MDDELRSTILPLAGRVDDSEPSPSPTTRVILAIREDQRDADWERVKPLIEAAQLQILNFERQNLHPETNHLGDDDHEAWAALQYALDRLGVGRE